MFNEGIQVNLTIGSRAWLTAEVKVYFFYHFFSVSFDLKDWKVTKKKKNYALRVNLGPICFSIINVKRLNEHIEEAVNESRNNFELKI